MKIELRDLADIRPYEKNPRKNDQAVEAVAASIREFGFRQPIVVDAEGVIIVGHTRYKAALLLGLKQAPVVVAEDLTPEQAKAYRIADNQTAEASDWDLDLLPIELGELQAAGQDLAPLGFSSEALALLLAPAVQEGLTDPDDIPAPPAEPTARRGDLWKLGEHRLLCGDSGEAADVDRLLEGELADLVVTDPPYNVAVEPRSVGAIEAGFSGWPTVKKPGSKNREQLKASERQIENDQASEAEFGELLNRWFGNLTRALKPGRSFYIWGGYSNVVNYPAAILAQDLHFAQVIVWDKEHPLLNRKDFLGAHESAYYGWRRGAAHRFFGGSKVTDLWHQKKVNPAKMLHLTEKPVELGRKAMECSSLAGEIVLDLFGGSGSTLIAAEQMSRRARVMELDPAYCEVIVQRWEAFTGKKAEKIESGEPAELAELAGEMATSAENGDGPAGAGDPAASSENGEGSAIAENGEGLLAAPPAKKTAKKKASRKKKPGQARAAKKKQ